MRLLKIIKAPLKGRVIDFLGGVEHRAQATIWATGVVLAGSVHFLFS